MKPKRIMYTFWERNLHHTTRRNAGEKQRTKKPFSTDTLKQTNKQMHRCYGQREIVRSLCLVYTSNLFAPA